MSIMGMPKNNVGLKSRIDFAAGWYSNRSCSRMRRPLISQQWRPLPSPSSFPEVTLRLGEHRLQITAPGAPSKLYMNNASLDNEPVRNWWIGWNQLSKASKLDFTLSAEPNHDPGEAQPSFAPTGRYRRAPSPCP
jgi:hypothetical protein